MDDWKNLSVASAALISARRVGMYGNVENRLRRMARDSVPFTHADGNRRFEGFLLKIKGGTILDVTEFRPDVHRSPKQAEPKTFSGSSKRSRPDRDGPIVEFKHPGRRWAR